jgi:hypothetical protein
MRLKFMVALPALMLLAGAAQAVEQDFVKPKVGIFRLDWCKVWGGQCGQPAADKFCQTKGFVHSTNFEEAVDIGAATPTVVIDTGQQCGDPSCDGFTFITCEKPNVVLPLPLPLPLPSPPPGSGPGGDDTHTYYNPKIGGARVNICVTKGAECDGQSAADTYCSNKGWDDASDFTSTGKLPSFAKSRYIGNGKYCKGSNCKAFADITCENTP